VCVCVCVCLCLCLCLSERDENACESLSSLANSHKSNTYRQTELRKRHLHCSQWHIINTDSTWTSVLRIFCYFFFLESDSIFTPFSYKNTISFRKQKRLCKRNNSFENRFHCLESIFCLIILYCLRSRESCKMVFVLIVLAFN
jgi:hypothetical protein